MILPKLSPELEYDIVASIINAVGRPVTLTYVSTRSVCPVCGGTNPFCSTCHGNPTVDVTIDRTVTGNVRWKDSDQKRYRPEGQFVDGDCIVNFMVDTVEDYQTLDILLKKIISVTVDGRVCVLKRWSFKGSPINRVYLILSQDTDIGGQRIG